MGPGAHSMQRRDRQAAKNFRSLITLGTFDRQYTKKSRPKDWSTHIDGFKWSDAHQKSDVKEGQ